MSIKVWDYMREFEQERADIFEGLEKVFRSGRLILGESVKNFEQDFAAYCGVKYGVGVDNATNGLFLALKALGIGAGDEVITVANTAVPTVAAITAAGATARFVDILPGTCLMNTGQLAAAITPRTRCLMPVHLYGQCVDMEAVQAMAQSQGLKIVEDASQSHGARQHGKRAGSLSDCGVFSFYPTKPLGAYGDGGIVITDSEAIDHKLRRLRFYGMENVYYAEESGYNSRLDEIQAEILLRKLKRLEGYLARRREIARRYDAALSGTSLALPQVAPGNEHVYYLYVVRHPERDRIIAELAKREILVNICYPWPIHTMRGYASLGYREGDLPETEAAARQVFSLPLYPTLTDAQQDTVCRALGEILGESVRL